VNIEFINRLKQLLEHFNSSPSLFADQVGVPRSSISHILSGRNKPSLDFILKVIAKFPQVDLYWLLNGKGSFPSPKEKENPTPTKLISKTKRPMSTNKKVERVIIFYQDGTFESYNPDK